MAASGKRIGGAATAGAKRSSSLLSCTLLLLLVALLCKSSDGAHEVTTSRPGGQRRKLASSWRRSSADQQMMSSEEDRAAFVEQFRKEWEEESQRRQKIDDQQRSKIDLLRQIQRVGRSGAAADSELLAANAAETQPQQLQNHRLAMAQSDFASTCTRSLMSYGKRGDSIISQNDFADFLNQVCVSAGKCSPSAPTIQFHQLYWTTQVKFVWGICSKDGKVGDPDELDECLTDLEAMGNPFGFDVKNKNKMDAVRSEVKLMCKSVYTDVLAQGLVADGDEEDDVEDKDVDVDVDEDGEDVVEDGEEDVGDAKDEHETGEDMDVDEDVEGEKDEDETGESTDQAPVQAPVASPGDETTVGEPTRPGPGTRPSDYVPFDDPDDDPATSDGGGDPPPPFIVPSKTTYAANEAVVVTFVYPDAQDRSWVAISDAGRDVDGTLPDEKSAGNVAWAWTCGKRGCVGFQTEGTIDFGILPPGTYQAYLLSHIPDSAPYDIEAESVEFTVMDLAALATNPCPSIDDPCMNEDNMHFCTYLFNSGCSVDIKESCPYQFACGQTTPPGSAPPTAAPTSAPTALPTISPTAAPTANPTANPTTASPTVAPTTASPTVAPTTSAPTTFAQYFDVFFTYRVDLNDDSEDADSVSTSLSDELRGAIATTLDAQGISRRQLRTSRKALELSTAHSVPIEHVSFADTPCPADDGLGAQSCVLVVSMVRVQADRGTETQSSADNAVQTPLEASMAPISTLFQDAIGSDKVVGVQWIQGGYPVEGTVALGASDTGGSQMSSGSIIGLSVGLTVVVVGMLFAFNKIRRRDDDDFSEDGLRELKDADPNELMDIERGADALVDNDDISSIAKSSVPPKMGYDPYQLKVEMDDERFTSVVGPDGKEVAQFSPTNIDTNASVDVSMSDMSCSAAPSSIAPSTSSPSRSINSQSLGTGVMAGVFAGSAIASTMQHEVGQNESFDESLSFTASVQTGDQAGDLTGEDGKTKERSIISQSSIAPSDGSIKSHSLGTGVMAGVFAGSAVAAAMQHDDDDASSISASVQTGDQTGEDARIVQPVELAEGQLLEYTAIAEIDAALDSGDWAGVLKVASDMSHRDEDSSRPSEISSLQPPSMASSAGRARPQLSKEDAKKAAHLDELIAAGDWSTVGAVASQYDAEAKRLPPQSASLDASDTASQHSKRSFLDIITGRKAPTAVIPEEGSSDEGSAVVEATSGAAAEVAAGVAAAAGVVAAAAASPRSNADEASQDMPVSSPSASTPPDSVQSSAASAGDKNDSPDSGRAPNPYLDQTEAMDWAVMSSLDELNKDKQKSDDDQSSSLVSADDKPLMDKPKRRKRGFGFGSGSKRSPDRNSSDYVGYDEKESEDDKKSWKKKLGFIKSSKKKTSDVACLALQEDSSVESRSLGSDAIAGQEEKSSRPSDLPSSERSSEVSGHQSPDSSHLLGGSFAAAALPIANVETQSNPSTDAYISTTSSVTGSSFTAGDYTAGDAADDAESKGGASLRDELDQAIERGDWEAVERQAAEMLEASSSEASSVGVPSSIDTSEAGSGVDYHSAKSTRSSKSSTGTSVNDEQIQALEKLIEADDWQGIVETASKYRFKDKSIGSASREAAEGEDKDVSKPGTEGSVNDDELQHAVEEANKWEAIAQDAASKISTKKQASGASEAAEWAIGRSLAKQKGAGPSPEVPSADEV